METDELPSDEESLARILFGVLVYDEQATEARVMELKQLPETRYPKAFYQRTLDLVLEKVRNADAVRRYA